MQKANLAVIAAVIVVFEAASNFPKNVLSDGVSSTIRSVPFIYSQLLH